MLRTWLLAGVMLAALVTPVMAAEPGTAPVAKVSADTAAKKLTLERLFSSPDLAGAQPRVLKLSPDGTLLTSLKPRPDEKDRLDLWALDTRTGKERMLVDSRKVGSGAELSEAEKMQRERARIGGSKGSIPRSWRGSARRMWCACSAMPGSSGRGPRSRRRSAMPGPILRCAMRAKTSPPLFGAWRVASRSSGTA